MANKYPVVAARDEPCLCLPIKISDSRVLEVSSQSIRNVYPQMPAISSLPRTLAAGLAADHGDTFLLDAQRDLSQYF